MAAPVGALLRKALLVEDNAVNQEVALAMLQHLGVETLSAWSGEEALEKLTSERFDVVLMDCQMPKLDGYATTARFRDWEVANERARTPIVALTANALSGDADLDLWYDQAAEWAGLQFKAKDGSAVTYERV